MLRFLIALMLVMSSGNIGSMNNAEERGSNESIVHTLAQELKKSAPQNNEQLNKIVNDLVKEFKDINVIRMEPRGAEPTGCNQYLVGKTKIDDYKKLDTCFQTAVIKAIKRDSTSEELGNTNPNFSREYQKKFCPAQDLDSVLAKRCALIENAIGNNAKKVTVREKVVNKAGQVVNEAGQFLNKAGQVVNKVVQKGKDFFKKEDRTGQGQHLSGGQPNGPVNQDVGQYQPNPGVPSDNHQEMQSNGNNYNEEFLPNK